MKKWITWMLAASLTVSLSACGSTTSIAPEETEAVSEVVTTEQVNIEGEGTEKTEEDSADDQETEAVSSQPAEEPNSENVEQEDPSEAPELSKLPEQVQKTLEVITEYGPLDDGSDYADASLLSFSFVENTLVEENDYYLVDVVLNKPITVPGDLAVGDTCTITVNELAGEQQEIVKTSDNTYGIVGDEDGEDDRYYNYQNSKTGAVTLFEASEDRVDCSFFEGTLAVAKDAKVTIAILSETHTLEPEDLEDGNWFNVVRFDEDGIVSELVFVGD